MKVIRLLLPWLIFVAASSAMLLQFNWAALWSVLGEIDLLLALGGGTAAMMVFFVIRGVRTWLLLYRVGVRVPLADCLLSQSVAGGLASVTPGQVGEAVRVEMLKSVGHVDRGVGYAVFLSERFIDLAVLVCAGLAVVVFGIESQQGHAIVLTIAAVVCLSVLILLVFVAFGPCPRRLAALQPHLRPMLLSRDLVIINVLGGALSWGAIMVQWSILLHSVDISLGWFEVIQLVVLVMLAVIASLIPGGFAVSELVAANLLMQWGFASAQAEAGAIVLRLPSVEAGVLALGAWLVWSRLRPAQHRQKDLYASRTTDEMGR